MEDTAANVKYRTPFYADSSLWALIVSNLAIIAWALIEQWSLAPLMWIYWCQSAIIGVFWFFKLMSLREFSTKNFKINNRSVAPTTKTKIQTAFFFLAHYGFFHFGYLMFLTEERKVVTAFPILTAAGIFFVYQAYSHFYNQKWLIESKPNIGTMMFFPYARIIPMHLTIVAGSSQWGQQWSLAWFLGLKLLADAIMHIIERRGFADKPKSKVKKKRKTKIFPKRVSIENQNGTTIYTAGFWPGCSEVIMLSVAFTVIAGLLVGLLYFIRHISMVYEEFFTDFLGIPVLNTIFSFFIMGAIDFTFIIGLGFLVLWIPYFLSYQLSPKKFWIRDNTLYHKVRLLGFIPHQRKITFEQILNVEAEASNGRHTVSVLYERKLPKWLFVILVYWNEKLTQWPMTLINGIPTMEEAQAIQNALLEPMTASPACRVGA